MTLRYLFGPITAKFADHYLQTQRRQSTCLVFHTSEPVDVKIAYGDTWDEVLAKLPPDWRPDFLVLYLPYTAIPPALLRAPIPIMGCIYQELGATNEALRCLHASLERSQPSDSIVRKLYALIAACHRQLGRPEQALAACTAGRKHYPDDAEIRFHEGLVRRELRDPAGSEAAFLRLLSGQEKAHFASVEASLRGPKARHNLVVLYLEQGRLAEAEAQWRTALVDEPDYGPAWLGLGELFLNQGRLHEVEEAIDRLDRPNGSPEDAKTQRERLGRRGVG